MSLTQHAIHCSVATRRTQWSALHCEYFAFTPWSPRIRTQSASDRASLDLLARGNIPNPDGNGKTAFISADSYLELSRLIGYTQTPLHSVNYNEIDLRRMCVVGG